MLTTEPNPTYLSTIVTLDDDAARQIVIGNGLSTQEAKQIGQLLHDTVEKMATDAADSENPQAAA